jgi:N-sulfoglucosamine sulfohydrolase
VRFFQTINKAAASNKTMVARMEFYKYRVSEELYDFKNDLDGLVNLINHPKFEAIKQRFKKLLSVQMKRSEETLYSKNISIKTKF